MLARFQSQRKEAATMLIAGMWNLWRERNNRIFEGKEETLLVVLRKTSETLELWAAARERERERERERARRGVVVGLVGGGQEGQLLKSIMRAMQVTKST